MTNQKRNRIDRLRLYGFDANTGQLANLDVPRLKAGEIKTIEINENSLHGAQLQTVRCPDLDSAKRVMGVSDDIARKRRRPLYECSNIRRFSVREVEKAVADKQVTNSMSEFLLRTTEHYVFGDSQLVKQFKPALETVFPQGAFDLKIAGWGTIILFEGWTFSVSPSINIVFADELIMETGARVRRRFAPIKFDIGEIRQISPQLPIST